MGVSFQGEKLPLRCVMDLDRCQHLCKIDSHHYPTEAETFDLKVSKLVDTFSGYLRVTVVAATANEPVTCRKGTDITITDKVGEQINHKSQINFLKLCLKNRKTTRIHSKV